VTCEPALCSYGQNTESVYILVTEGAVLVACCKGNRTGRQRVWKEVHIVLRTGHKDREWTTRGSGDWSTVSHRWRSVSTPDLCIFVVDRVTWGRFLYKCIGFPLSVTSPIPPLLHWHSSILIFVARQAQWV
jgi:hypothetical protein